MAHNKSILCSVGIWLLAGLYLGEIGLVMGASVIPENELQVFVRPGCPYCEEAKRFLPELQRRRPDLHIRVRDIYQDPQAGSSSC